jgi:hypothetical protein
MPSPPRAALMRSPAGTFSVRHAFWMPSPMQPLGRCQECNRAMASTRLVSVVVDRDRGRHGRYLNRRLRFAFLQSAEEDPRRRLGRGLTSKELGRALEQYPSDVKGERGHQMDGCSTSSRR